MLGGPFELVDNNAYGSHREALTWLSATYPSAPLAVATGFVGLGGLHALAQLLQAQPRLARLLLGAAPAPGTLPAEQASEAEPAVRDQFQQSLDALRRERDFQSFPPLRRAMLEGVAAMLRRDDVAVRRYTKRFLHGKAYLLGQRNEHGGLNGAGAALVSSANLTSAGLTSNLELGLVQYQPNVVRMALDWYEGLWAQADEFKDDLLDLLLPVLPETDPQTVFLRALLELYGDELPPETDVRPGEGLTRFQRDGYERARRILERYHGVVYADGVGTGKTEIGVEFIKDYARHRGLHTLVISPAQLRDRLWEKRLDEANLPGQVVSFQELAMDRQLVPDRADTKKVLAVDKDTYRLVIVDEAHAFRNADTYWYEALDRLMGGEQKDLVLLTATPVNNSLWDIHSLLLLFGRHDGAFGSLPLRIRSLRKFFLDVGANDPENISEVRLFPLIDAVAVRRDRSFLEKHYPNDHFPDGTPVRFPKPRLIEQRYDLDVAYPGIVREIVKAIDALTMARYRPSAYLRDDPKEAADEEALAGLIKSGLLKRFESSWRAALLTVQRMRNANAVVVESWRKHEVVPPLSSLRELADEILGGASLSEVVAEALTQDGALSADAFTDKFSQEVEQDLTVMSQMAADLERLGKKPDPKLAELRHVLAQTPAKKVAIFAAYGDSVRYIKDVLERDRSLAGGQVDRRNWQRDRLQCQGAGAGTLLPGVRDWRSEVQAERR